VEQVQGRSGLSRGLILVAASTVVAVGAMLASRVGDWSGGWWDVAWTSSAFGALVGTLMAVGRAHPANRSRWKLWALAAAFWLLGQIAWDLYGVIGFPQSPSLADAGWWVFALIVVASVLRVRGRKGMQMVALIEAAPLIGAAIALIVGEMWPDIHASALALGPKLSAVAYPILYATAAVLMLQAMVAGALRTQRTPAVMLVLGGMSAQAVAFIFWSSQLLRGAYVSGNTLLDPLWVIGLIAIGAGGVLASRRPDPQPKAQEPGDRGGILPTALFGLVVVALIKSQLDHSDLSVRLALEAGLVFSSAALLMRSHLLSGRLRGMLDRERRALSDLAEREGQLAELNVQLHEDSRRDALTGIRNRRALADDLPLIKALHEQEGETFAFALCDVDYFKAYNDLLGHLAGDQALRAIAAIARGALRTEDSAYRFGGEELLLVMRGVEIDDAVRIAERVRAAVEDAAISHPRAESGVLTVSIGVAAGGDTSELLARADAALYGAKRTGRNQVLASSPSDPLPALARLRERASDEPLPRQLRSMLAVSRAAASGHGPIPLLHSLAVAIRTEMSFQVVAVNLFDEVRERLQVVVVDGDHDAHETLFGTSTSWEEWEMLLSAGEDIHGAVWLEAGSYTWDSDAVVWTPPGLSPVSAEAWNPQDMLLLPVRDSDGEVLGIISVDQPLLGRRPTHEELAVLMAVVDHAGLALEQVQRGAKAIREESAELRLAAVLLLAETLDMRDHSTALHSRTVGRLVRETAEELGLEQARVDRIGAAGVLHDLGKLGIADAILHKPGPLDENEWREIKRHPEVGARILEHAGMRDIALWVGQHHERVDGCGYPLRLEGEAIALEARILAVADAYEAMITDRPYRTGMPAEDARAELERCAGTQFDTRVVRAFLDALDSASEPVVEGLERAA
jgi:diguanylate cyclase (GGDEF)-like protein